MLKKFFYLNCILILVFSLLGSFLSTTAQPLLTEINNNRENHDSFLTNLTFILQTNLTTFIICILGAMTFGIYSLLILCWNSYHLGSGLIFVSNTLKANQLYVYSYILAEFTALCMIVTVAEYTGIKQLCFLLEIRGATESNKERPLLLFITSLLLILLAGIIEAYYMHIS